MFVSGKFFAGTLVFGVVSTVLFPYFYQKEKVTMGDGKPENIYGFNVSDIDGNLVSLSTYQGFVCLIVNVASQ